MSVEVTLHVSKAQKTKYNKGDPFQIKDNKTGDAVTVVITAKQEKAMRRNWAKGSAYRVKDYEKGANGGSFLKKLGIKKDVEKLVKSVKKKSKKETENTDGDGIERQVDANGKEFIMLQGEKLYLQSINAQTGEVETSGGKFSLNRGLKKIGVKKAAHRAAKKAKKELKKRAIKGLKEVGKDLLNEGTEIGVRGAFQGLNYVPGASAVSQKYGWEDKAVKGAQKAVRNSLGKEIDGLGVGAGKGSQAMKDRMAKLRALRTAKAGGSFKAAGGSFKSAGGSFKAPSTGGMITHDDTKNAILGLTSPTPQIQNTRNFRKRAGINGAGFLQ